ncbi:MAG: cupin domain-containing protein [Candidatus Velthaea sp.]
MIVTDNLDHLFADAQREAAQPLWTVMEAMVPPHPKPKAVPHLWRYAQLRPLLERAGQLVGTQEAERRVFMLVNPALAAPMTTDTLYAGLQLILPGEVARAHRHVSFALRFIIEGDGAYTAVGGEKVTMERGDLVLTPSWNWHDHGHEGASAMVWLDGLDLPMYQFVPAMFAEPYDDERYPSNRVAAVSPLKYPWTEMQSALASAGGAFAEQRYAHREHGGPISRIIGAAAERIDAGASAPRRRETASSVYHVHEGSGSTTVGDAELQWSRGDTFCVPAWSPYMHRARDAAHLFRFDDRPLLEAIGAYRSEN